MVELLGSQQPIRLCMLSLKGATLHAETLSAGQGAVRAPHLDGATRETRMTDRAESRRHLKDRRSESGQRCG